MVQKRRIDRVLEVARPCKEDSDCHLVSLGCLGCDMSLNGAEQAPEVTRDIGTFTANCPQTCPLTDCAARQEELRAVCKAGVCATEVVQKPETSSGSSSGVIIKPNPSIK